MIKIIRGIMVIDWNRWITAGLGRKWGDIGGIMDGRWIRQYTTLLLLIIFENHKNNQNQYKSTYNSTP